MHCIADLLFSANMVALLKQLPCFRVQATQRTGRAGRTRPGKCFRLYTRGDFEQRMPAETVPEILRTSLQAAVLHLKTLPLEVDVLHFDYMDAPQVMQAPGHHLQLWQQSNCMVMPCPTRCMTPQSLLSAMHVPFDSHAALAQH